VAEGMETPQGRRRRRVALTAPRESVRAAGGVLRRVGPKGMEVLLVHRPRYGDWTLPKGKAQPGESDEETALREVEEETGLRASLGFELPSTRYRDSQGRDKIVRYWTMRPESGSFEPHAEVDAIEWTPIKDVGSKLSYERDAEVLRAVPPPLLVVRHATAGDRENWEGDDARRPLDKRGRKQAEALVDRLAGFDVDRILSSPMDRCVQTVEPLARARGVELETSDELAEGAGAERVRALLHDLAGVAAVVCGHGPDHTPLFGKVKKGETLVLEPTDDQLGELGRIRV
jgi:8-oxo-dGTP pyrophosphatase MutT (NUDIX family)/phosphohistidine phosphatase SixA